MAGNAPEVARATVTIIPSMEGAQRTISEELGVAADSAGSSAGKRAGSSFSSALKGGLATAGAAVTAVGTAVAAGGKALVSSAGDVAAYGDEIDKMSQKLGLSAEAYQEWDYVLKLSGTEMSSMSTGLKTLTNKLDDAKNGSADAQEMFAQLGISLEDIGTMSREDLFAKTIEGFQGMADSTDRAALANDLFGKSGQNLAPLFNQTAEATRGLIQEAHDYGMVMSDEAVASSAAFEDSLLKMQNTMGGLKNSLVSEFLPSITSIMDGIALIVSGDSDGGMAIITEGINSFVANLTEIIPKMLEVGMGIVKALGQAIIDNLPALIDTAVPLLMEIVDAIIDNLPTLLKAAQQIIVEIALGIADALPDLIPTIVETILFIVDGLIDNIDLLVDAGIQLIIGLSEGLINAVPKLIEKAPEIVLKLVEAIIRNAPKLIGAALELIANLVIGIVNSFGKIIETGANIVNKVKDGFMEKIQAAKDWGKDLIDNFIGGIKQKWEDLKSAVSNVANTVKEFLGFSEPEKGPLSNFHTYAPDMMKLFAQGIRDNEDLISTQLDSSLDVSGVFTMGAPETGTGTVMSIMDAISGLVGDITIPVYIGTDKIDDVVVAATQRVNYRSGGR